MCPSMRAYTQVRPDDTAISSIYPSPAFSRGRKPDNQDKHGKQTWQTSPKPKTAGSLNGRPRP
jgi:hypothetical protein